MEQVPDGLPLTQDLWANLDPAVKAAFHSLLQRLRDLEDRVKQNSSNSSRPPSSDPPWAKPVRTKKKPSGRRRGGQPGHEPHVRQLFPPEALTDSHDYHPKVCAHCCSPLEAGVDEELAEPVRHQVIDIPEVKPFVVEYRRHVLTCHVCRNETVAALPEGVPLCMSGPKLQAWVAALTVRYRLSKREAKDLLDELLGIVVSLGGISDIEQYLSEALEAPVAEIQQALESADVANHDETGWREANQKAWLWTSVSQNYAVYKIDLRRSGEVARTLLDAVNFNGHIGSDRYKAYNCYPMERRGICHAHLDRDYKKIADREGPGQWIGRELRQQEALVFHVWHEFKAGTITRPILEERILPIAEAIGELLVKGTECGDSKVAGMCTDILRHWEALWTFVYVPGMEPTNNTAEQALRPYVLWRKGNFGTQSERGSRFMERMMSIIQTCRRQGRRFLGFLEEAVRCHNLGRPAPSLLVNTG